LLAGFDKGDKRALTDRDTNINPATTAMFNKTMVGRNWAVIEVKLDPVSYMWRASYETTME